MISKKYLMIGLLLLMVMPTVFAADLDRPPIDLFYLFVENVFGNILMAIFGVAVILVVICMLGGMSSQSTIFISGAWFITGMVGYFGAFGLVFPFILIVLAFWRALRTI